MTREYNEDEEQYLIVFKCNFIFFDSAVCDMMMYSALIQYNLPLVSKKKRRGRSIGITQAQLGCMENLTTRYLF